MGLVGGFHSLPIARCDDGQDGGFGRRFWCVCVVPCWVGVTPTCINELMWRLMLAFKSPLVLWPWCPPLYPPFLSHTNTLFPHTVNITHAGRYSLIYIASRKHCCFALPQHSAVEMRKNGHLRFFFFTFVRKRASWRQNMGLVCVFTCTCTCMLTGWHWYKQWEQRKRCHETFSWQKQNDFLLCFSIFSSWLFLFFVCVFFPTHSPSPLKNPHFCSGSQRGLPNAQLLSSVSSPVSRYANFLWWSEGHRDKSAAL